MRGGHGASKLVRLRRAASVARVRVGWEAGAGRRALLRCYGEGAFSSGGGKVHRRRAEAPFLAWRLNVVAPAPAPAPAFAVWPELAGLFQYN